MQEKPVVVFACSGIPEQEQVAYYELARRLVLPVAYKGFGVSSFSSEEEADEALRSSPVRNVALVVFYQYHEAEGLVARVRNSYPALPVFVVDPGDPEPAESLVKALSTLSN